MPTDNRPVPKPHFAAVSMQPPAPRPAPAILQPISTTATGSKRTKPGRSRKSLVPVARAPRASNFGGGNSFQSFTLPGAVMGRRILEEKISEEDSAPSGNLGFGLTEKEIDERVGFF